MGLITEKINVKLSSKNIKYYESLGYVIPRVKTKWYDVSVLRGTEIEIFVNDLSYGSGEFVDCICDGVCCNKQMRIKWQNYIKNRKDDGTIYCISCTSKLFGNESARLTRLKNSISFYQWCIDNNRQDILDRWDYIKNKLRPEEISIRSGKDIYFLCPKGIHESEIKDICGFTTGHEGCMDCDLCNSLGFKFSKSINVWSNDNEKSPFEYSYGTKEPVWWICENGKHEIYFRSILSSVKFDFRCPECSNEKSESFLQEKIRLYLEELCNKYGWILNHEYKCELKCFNIMTGKLLPYDNEIIANNFKLIIETNGEQHYKPSKWNKFAAKIHNTTPEYELEYTQWKDKIKMDYALENGYYYLAIPYTADDKNETWKLMIDDALNYIYENTNE